MVVDALRNYLAKFVRTTLTKIAKTAERRALRGIKHLHHSGSAVRQSARDARRRTHRLWRRAGRIARERKAAAVAATGAALDNLQAIRTCVACGARTLERFPIQVGRTTRGTFPRKHWLVGCRSCGMLFTTRRPTRATLDEYYGIDGRWAQDHRNATQFATSKVSAEVFDSVAAAAGLRHPVPGARALDIGCGNGAWLNSLARYGWATFGLEPSTRVAFEQHRELTTIPADESFDFVILNHVLEHVRDPGAMLRAASGALRPGAVLFISVPSLDGLPRHHDFRYCINGVYHLQAFTESCLRTLLGRAGCEDITSIAISVHVPDGRSAKQMRLLARRRVAPSPNPPTPRAPLDAARTALMRAGVLADNG